MQLSILLPSLRPHELTGCLPALHAAADGLDYELVVISDAELSDAHPRTRCIIEAAPEGPIHATLTGLTAARGDYLFTCSDEDRLQPRSLFKMHVRAELARKLGTHAIHCPWFPNAGPWQYYGRTFAPWPFIHKDLAKQLGGLFDPAYHAHYADPDLGMRAAEAHVGIRLHDDLTLAHPNPHDDLHLRNHARWFDADERVFRSKWAHLESPACRPEFTYS
jgi:glycosyltransferase involved in cell wall biosynthesis